MSSTTAAAAAVTW